MNKKVILYYKIFGLIMLISLIALFIYLEVVGFASNPYTIETKEDLLNYVSTEVANQNPELLIKYTGEDYKNMKSWFKSYFSYDNLVTKGEYSFYNYNGAKFTYWSYSGYKLVRVKISYKQTPEENALVRQFVLNKIDSDGIRNMTQYDAMRYVTDFLSDSFDYKSGQNRCIDVINTKQSNCYGYTMLFQLFMDELGIPCRTTYGKMNIDHIWNVVQLDGQWYYIDVTWDKTYNTYFLVSTDQISKTHTITGHFIPNCSSNYVKQEEVVETPKVEDVIVEEKPKEEVIEEPKEEVVETPKVEDTIKEDIVVDEKPKEDVIYPSTNPPISIPDATLPERPESNIDRILRLLRILRMYDK